MEHEILGAKKRPPKDRDAEGEEGWLSLLEVEEGDRCIAAGCGVGCRAATGWRGAEG